MSKTNVCLLIIGHCYLVFIILTNTSPFHQTLLNNKTVNILYKGTIFYFTGKTLLNNTKKMSFRKIYFPISQGKLPLPIPPHPNTPLHLTLISTLDMLVIMILRGYHFSLNTPVNRRLVPELKS